MGVWRQWLEGRSLEESRMLLNDHGITPASLVRGGFFPYATVDEKQTALDDNFKAIDAAAEIGAPQVVLVSGAKPDLSLAESRKHITEGIASCVAHAKSVGVKLAIEPRFKLSDKELKEDNMTLVEVLIAPRSKLINATLKSLDFRRRFKAIVLAVQRKEQTLRKKLNSVRLKFGDALLIQAHAKDVAQLRTDSDFVVLDEVDAPSLRKGKAPVALTIVAVAVALAALGVFPILHTAIAGCAAMILTRCINMEQAYAAVDWKVIFLLAGILPLGLAMESTGAAQLIADNTLGLVSDMGPLIVLAVLYLLTATLTETMSNNASAVLLAPIAISISKDMNVDPKPFLMAVCFAASTSFATPVGYQTNTMVYNPGGYKFTDFMKVGIPLNLIFWALAVFFIPIFWPFHPCEVAGTASP